MNAAAYARYSSDNQREESIDAQVRAIKEYAQRNGYDIVKVYADEARSATTSNRPQFLQMVNDSSLGMFNAVIVHKLDRFSRDRYDSAFYKRELKKNDAKLVSVLENLDDSPESIILESVLQGMVEYYSANLARETMKGLIENSLQCKHTGGIPPLGYDINEDNTYVINEYEAHAVHMIFEMYSDGRKYGAIIDALEKEGYKTKRGNGFGKNSLHDILFNEKYIGTYIFNRSVTSPDGRRNKHKSKPEEEIVRIPNGIPAILSIDLWERTQKRLEKNKKGRGANSAKEVYLLSGLVYCSKCNGGMYGQRKFAGKTGTKYRCYACGTRYRNHLYDMTSIPVDIVENIVMEQLVNDLFSAKAMEKMVDKIYLHASSRSKELSQNIKQLENELTEVKNKIKNIVDAITEGMYHASMKSKMDELEVIKSTLTKRIEEAKRKANINSPTWEMVFAYLKKDMDKKDKNPEEQKRIFQTYVKKVVVYDDKIETDTIVILHGVPDRNRTRISGTGIRYLIH